MHEVNPYAPPGAVVSDLHLNEEIPRPRRVGVAAMLLWADLSVWFLSTLFDVSAGNILKGASPVVVVIVIAFSAGLNTWLIVKVAAGRNWARILWLVLSVVGMIAQFATGFPSGLIDRSSWILQTLMNLAVFGILLTPSAARWFKR
jgi:hypothetical protein